MTRLSVNINKIALIRNARESNLPDLRKVAMDCESFGAQGITVHPRPDQRHVRFSDIPMLKEVVTTEYNIEGYPSEDFLNMVCDIRPDQCTLVPDPPGVLTSSEGWDTIKHKDFLIEVIKKLKGEGIRVSIFMDPILDLIEVAKEVGTDRIELYTGKYALHFDKGNYSELDKHITASQLATKVGLGLNAGHDLNLDNLFRYKSSVSDLLEVSIGHALVCDAIYYGLKNTIQMYLHQLNKRNYQK